MKKRLRRWGLTGGFVLGLWGALSAIASSDPSGTTHEAFGTIKEHQANLVVLETQGQLLRLQVPPSLSKTLSPLKKGDTVKVRYSLHLQSIELQTPASQLPGTIPAVPKGFDYWNDRAFYPA